MAKRTGASTMIKLAQAVCRAQGKFGVAGVIARTGSPALGAALEAVASACHAWESTSPTPGKVVLPFGAPDVDPPGGA